MNNKKTIINAPLATQSDEDDFEVSKVEDIAGTFAVSDNVSEYTSSKTHRLLRGTVVLGATGYDLYPTKFPVLYMSDLADGAFRTFTLAPIPDDTLDTTSNGMVAIWNKTTKTWDSKIIESYTTNLLNGEVIDLSNIVKRVYYFAGAKNNDVALPDGTVFTISNNIPINDIVITITLPKFTTVGSLTINSPTHPIHILNGAYSTTLRNVIMIHAVKVLDVYHLHTVIRNY